MSDSTDNLYLAMRQLIAWGHDNRSPYRNTQLYDEAKLRLDEMVDEWYKARLIEETEQ